MFALIVLLALVIGFVVLVVATNSRKDASERDGLARASAEFEAWVRNTPDWNLPPVVVRVYDGAGYGARNYQYEASLLATRGYRVNASAAGSHGGPGMADIAAFGVLAFGQRRQSSMTVTYSRQ
jgi:hypothetical protein